MLGKPVSVAKEWEDLQVEVINLSSLVIAGCLRSVYKFSLPIPPITDTNVIQDQGRPAELVKEGTAPLKKDTTSTGDKRS